MIFHRYDFATKVALGKKLSLDDMFAYLEGWAKYNIAFRQANSKELRDYPKLKNDCELKKLTDTIKAHLINRITWAEAKAPIADRSGILLSQQALFGIPDDDSMASNLAKNMRADVASEALWLPFELSGLEQCKGFFTE